MDITYREFSKLFINFLKENNALEDFRREVNKQTYHITNNNWYVKINPLQEPTIRACIIDGKFARVIDFAFKWIDTDKGHIFWSKLNAKFAEKVVKSNLKLKLN